jgi:hypothetical protein
MHSHIPGVPQYVGIHSHRLGYPSEWECIDLYWGTPVFGKAFPYNGGQLYVSKASLTLLSLPLLSELVSSWGCWVRISNDIWKYSNFHTHKRTRNHQGTNGVLSIIVNISVWKCKIVKFPCPWYWKSASQIYKQSNRGLGNSYTQFGWALLNNQYSKVNYMM